MATSVSGPLKLVTDQPATFVQVMVRAPKPRPHAGGMVVDFTTPATVTDGVVEFPCVPGPAVLVVTSAGVPQITVPLVVPDRADASLEECIRAAKLADEWTLTELERLAQQIAADVADAGALAENLGGIDGIAQTRGALEEAAQTTTDNAQLVERAKTDTINAREEAEAASTTATEKAGIASGHADAAEGHAEDAGGSATLAGKDADRAEAARKGAETIQQGLPTKIDQELETKLPDELRAQLPDELALKLPGELDERVPPLVASSIADDRAVADAAAAAAADAVAEETEAFRWIRGTLDGTSDLTALADGLHTIQTGAVATALGLPEGTQGTLTQITLDRSGLWKRQYYRADPTDGPAVEYRRTYYSGNWRDWALHGGGGSAVSSWIRGRVQDDRPVDQMMTLDDQGFWTMTSAQAREQGMPRTVSYFVEVWSSGMSVMQEATAMLTPPVRYVRRGYNGSWSMDWEALGGGSTPAPTPDPVEADEYAGATSKNALNVLVPSAVDPTLTYATDHATLVADLKKRIGPITTGGKAAVALVADHGTTAFKEWVWAAAKARDIPFTMALAPEIHLDGKGDSRHQATNDDIKGWVSEGLAIASHSGDHDGAVGYFDVARQIVTSKKKLEEKLGAPVDSWVQPGYVLANGSYDGFGTGQSDSRYTDYYAGRLLQQTYPVITGYAGDDFVYPGDADLPVGVRRSLTERKDAYQGVIDCIRQAIDTGGKHVNFLHPYAIPESSDTYVTRTEYLAFLDWLVQKRDAGDLVLLTLPELAIARP